MKVSFKGISGYYLNNNGKKCKFDSEKYTKADENVSVFVEADKNENSIFKLREYLPEKKETKILIEEQIKDFEIDKADKGSNIFVQKSIGEIKLGNINDSVVVSNQENSISVKNAKNMWLYSAYNANIKGNIKSINTKDPSSPIVTGKNLNITYLSKESEAKSDFLKGWEALNHQI